MDALAGPRGPGLGVVYHYFSIALFPAEANVLDKDKEFGRWLEALCATGEGTDE